MTVIFCILVSSLLAYGDCSPPRSPFDWNSDLINVHQAVTYLNSIKGRTWTAGPNGFGKYLSMSQQKHRMGSFTAEINMNGPSVNEIPIAPETRTSDTNKNKEENHVYSYDDLPDNYDARKMYPHCTTISTIQDQSLCGCCWAACTAAAFSDRLCIHSKGMINVNISINHLMTCAKTERLHGCHGGWEEEAWKFIKENGVVSGGQYGTFDGCQPFLIKPCSQKYHMPCDDVDAALTPICRKNKCSNEWHEPEGKLYKAKYTWMMSGNATNPNNEYDIRREIYRNGPVTAAFKVYPPFSFYKSGIFNVDLKDWEEPRNGHAVRIVGWGVENKIPYWLIANSWGKEWGESGLFRMLRGSNYCQIESFINSGIPDIPQDIN
ncbi:cathepsin B-like [Planococcus citri]|uniref:cathepsin B-like n=1 Tax=Planococcus citri TaxID=170843 RepID=UPI0031F98FE8